MNTVLFNPLGSVSQWWETLQRLGIFGFQLWLHHNDTIIHLLSLVYAPGLIVLEQHEIALESRYTTQVPSSHQSRDLQSLPAIYRFLGDTDGLVATKRSAFKWGSSLSQRIWRLHVTSLLPRDALSIEDLGHLFKVIASSLWEEEPDDE